MSSTKMQAADTAPPDPTLFQYTNALKQFISPTTILPEKATGPVPTNKWWGNLLSLNAAGRLDPVYPSPYAVFIDNVAATIACSYLYDSMHQGPINVNGAISYYYFPRSSNLIFSCQAPSVQFSVEDWDDLTVQVSLTSGSSAFLRSVMALGQAYMTIQHGDVPICLSSESGIAAVDGQPFGDGFLYHGQVDVGKFVVTLHNGQRWLVCWSSPAKGQALTFTCDKQVLKSGAHFNGIVQAAIVASDDALQILEQYAGGYVHRGVVTCDTVHGFQYHWETRRAAVQSQQPTKASPPVLHFVLEHHKSILTFHSQAVVPALTLHSHTRGPMTAYLIDSASGNIWDFAFSEQDEQNVERCAQFHAPRDPSVQDIVENRLVDHLQDEINTAATWTLPPGYYFKGKALQKYGSLCLLAAKLASYKEFQTQVAPLAATALSKLKQLLDTANEFPLCYDVVYKGLITSEVFVKHDVNVEFGNAVYNDHHYHYGYFITAAAMMYHLDPSYMTKNTRLCAWIETLVRDVMSASIADAYFPRFRHFDWFLGHGLSHGVTSVVDGKDEESTSEEINCWYGIALWAAVTGNTRYVLLLHQSVYIFVIGVFVGRESKIDQSKHMNQRANQIHSSNNSTSN
ncbi:hypothetical protein, variant 1 [Aphanomyces astaci]|uniref:glucan endo-1,3-beta-D-glucosidase n=1 Tax=Aphanomyces astaci TaxID=112090 RepID=W4FA27_APHAT|nr:hypothetical protein, variant 1 [Aphanomyces astaci]ETV64317.1 hypothetical protein, variant 1 [Aphanomyces astaci]|eukprot:XP_009846202.1 hypothetical protein, variant 1 [Aphanomyces astaci]